RLPVDPGVAVADFLIFEPLFPRSVLCCLQECQKSAHAISGHPLWEPGDAVEAALDDLVSWLNRNDIQDLVGAGLHESLTRVVNTVHYIGETIRRTYFEVVLQAPPGGVSPHAAGATSAGE